MIHNFERDNKMKTTKVTLNKKGYKNRNSAYSAVSGYLRKQGIDTRIVDKEYTKINGRMHVTLTIKEPVIAEEIVKTVREVVKTFIDEVEALGTALLGDITIEAAVNDETENPVIENGITDMMDELSQSVRDGTIDLLELFIELKKATSMPE